MISCQNLSRLGVKKYQLESLLFKLGHDYIGVYKAMMKFKSPSNT